MEEMSKISEEIIKIKFKPSDTLKDCENKFFKIMRKYGIKQGKPAYNDSGDEVGTAGNNFEWTICHTLFMESVKSYFMFSGLLYGVPKDLRK